MVLLSQFAVVLYEAVISRVSYEVSFVSAYRVYSFVRGGDRYRGGESRCGEILCGESRRGEICGGVLCNCCAAVLVVICCCGGVVLVVTCSCCVFLVVNCCCGGGGGAVLLTCGIFTFMSFHRLILTSQLAILLFASSSYLLIFNTFWYCIRSANTAFTLMGCVEEKSYILYD